MAVRYDSLTAIANSFRIVGITQQVLGGIMILSGPVFVIATLNNPIYIARNLPTWPIATFVGILIGVTFIVRGVLQVGYGEALLALADIAVGSTSNMSAQDRTVLLSQRSISSSLLQLAGLVAFCGVCVAFAATMAP